VKYQVGCIKRCLTNDLVFKITNGELRRWDFVFIFRRTHAYLYVLNKHLMLYCTSTPKLHARSLKLQLAVYLKDNESSYYLQRYKLY
jgi:hypothetical protein